MTPEQKAFARSLVKRGRLPIRRIAESTSAAGDAPGQREVRSAEAVALGAILAASVERSSAVAGLCYSPVAA